MLNMKWTFLTVSGFANNTSHSGKYSDHLQAKDILGGSWGFVSLLAMALDGFFFLLQTVVSVTELFWFFNLRPKKTRSNFFLIKMPEYH